MLKSARNSFERAIIKAAFDMLRYAKRICPVDSGRLRSTIKFRLEPGRLVLGAYTNYASCVEFGTPRMIAAHGEHDPKNPVKDWEALRKRQGRGQMMPFVRPALHMFVNVFLPRRLKMELGKG